MCKISSAFLQNIYKPPALVKLLPKTCRISAYILSTLLRTAKPISTFVLFTLYYPTTINDNIALIGARYDRRYKITKEQLEQLAPCVKKLHEVTERICKEKIESFI